MFGFFLNIHSPQANADGARGDNDDPMAMFPELDRRVHDQGQDGQKGLMSLFVNN